MAEYFVNNEQDIYCQREPDICYFWEKSSWNLGKYKPPKVTYGLLRFLFLVIDESNFWTSSDIVYLLNFLAV